MKISVRFTAAVHTLLCIQYFEKDMRVTSDFISASTGVNAVIIRKILLQLQKAGLVKTAAGIGGSHLASMREQRNGRFSISIRIQIRNALSEARFTVYWMLHYMRRNKQWQIRLTKQQLPI